MRVSSSDAFCRYLGEAYIYEAAGYQLAGYLRNEGLLGSSPAQIKAYTELGWVTPRLRVSLPGSMFEAWRSFPTFPVIGEIPEEDGWALRLWLKMASPGHLGSSNHWHRHYLDDPEDASCRTVANHLIAPEAHRPAAISVHGLTVLPYLDFFSYWQAYELAEIVDAASIAMRIVNDGHAVARAAAFCEEVPRRVEASSRSIERIQREWRALGPTFEVLSRYKTMLGLSLRRTGDLRSEIKSAACEIASTAGLSSTDLKASIRDHLLVLYEARGGGRTQASISKLLVKLRSDIELALDFWQQLGGGPVDFADPFWGEPADRQNRGWTPLPRAYPREDLVALERFGDYVHRYPLGLLGHVADRAATSSDGLRALATQTSRKTWSFRQLVLALHRLHLEIKPARLDESVVRSPSPETQLRVLAIHAQLFLEHVLPKPTRQVIELVRETAESLAAWLGAPDAQLLASRFQSGGLRLDGLEVDGRLPDPPDQLTAGLSGTSQKVATACFRFGILRNYAAHHDAHDHNLQKPEIAMLLSDTLSIVTVAAMKLAGQSNSEEAGVHDHEPK